MIKILSHTHIDLCYDLHRACFKKNWSHKTFEDFLNNESITIWGQFSDHIMTSMIVVAFIVDQAEIYTVCTHPDYRQKQYASKLLSYLKSEAKDRLMDEIFLDVSKDNIGAIKLYKSQNFTEVDIRKDYYQTDHRCTDAIIMNYVL